MRIECRPSVGTEYLGRVSWRGAWSGCGRVADQGGVELLVRICTKCLTSVDTKYLDGVLAKYMGMLCTEYLESACTKYLDRECTTYL